MKTVKKLEAECQKLVFKGLDNKTFDFIDINCTCFITDGVLKVSGEDGKNLVDYYGNYRGGYPYIDPILEKFAADNNCYWEWENPGCIGLYGN